MIQPDWAQEKIDEHLRNLQCWKGEISIASLIGGLCNKSFVVTDSNDKYVARIGTDILVHNITQTSVQTSMRAAADIEVTPALRYTEPQLAVVDFLEGGCVRPEDIEGNEENCRKNYRLCKATASRVACSSRSINLFLAVSGHPAVHRHRH